MGACVLGVNRQCPTKMHGRLEASLGLKFLFRSIPKNQYQHFVLVLPVVVPTERGSADTKGTIENNALHANTFDVFHKIKIVAHRIIHIMWNIPVQGQTFSTWCAPGKTCALACAP